MTWWQKTELGRERFLPAAFSVAAGLIFYRYGKGHIPDKRPGELLTSAIAVAAITVGFLANMKAILFSIEKKRIIAQLKDSAYYGYLIGYVISAIRWSFLLALLSGAALLVDFEHPPGWLRIGAAIWVAMLILAICTYYRVLSVFGTILKSND